MMAKADASARPPEWSEPEAGIPGAPLCLDPRNPMPSARVFVRARYMNYDETTRLHFHRGSFFRWEGQSYTEVAEREIRAELWDFLEAAARFADGRYEPFRPTSRIVSDVLDALRAVTILSDAVSPPAWLDHRKSPEPADLLSCRNGLLELTTGRILQHSPLFFGLNASGTDFDAEAPEPAEWLKFLWSLWPDDGEAIDALQEIFGYALTTDTRQQKAFLLVGPKRSGKGTIARVLKALLGERNVAAPTLSSLGMNFGLAPLIGKPLAIISDARLSGRADQHLIAERLLSISGEDLQTIDRKHKEPWTGTLPTRFLILTNELPRIADSSGALASRFIVLTLKQSFYGREDHSLTERLLGEMSGILNWSLEGLRRLRARGRFRQPTSSEEAIQALEDLGSPIGAFIRERCEIDDSEHYVECATLFAHWKQWCEEQGRHHPGTAQTFGRDLRAAVPRLDVEQPRELDRKRVYKGIRLA